MAYEDMRDKALEAREELEAEKTESADLVGRAEMAETAMRHELEVMTKVAQENQKAVLEAGELLKRQDAQIKELHAAYENETLSTMQMANYITELERDKKWLIEAGEKLMRWVEAARHSHEEVRDHNGRLKDTGIWANFYTAVRGIQRKDTPKPSCQNNTP